MACQALEDGGGGKKAQALRKLAEAQAAAKAKRKNGGAEAPKAAGGPDLRLQARLPAVFGICDAAPVY